MTKSNNDTAFASDAFTGMGCAIIALMIILPLILLSDAQGASIGAEDDMNIQACTDPQNLQSWEDAATGAPTDRLLQLIHAVFEGMCIKAQRGQIRILDAYISFSALQQLFLEVKEHPERFESSEALLEPLPSLSEEEL